MTDLNLVLLHGPDNLESTILGIPAIREPAVRALPDLASEPKRLLAAMLEYAEAVADGERHELQLLAGSQAHVRELAGIAVDLSDAHAKWEARAVELDAEVARLRAELAYAAGELEIQRGIAASARDRAICEGQERLRLQSDNERLARENAEIRHHAAELERAIEVHGAARQGLLVQFGDLCMDLCRADSEVRRLHGELASRDVLAARFDSAARAITGKSAAELAWEIQVPPADDDEFDADTVDIPVRNRVATEPAMPAARRRMLRVIDARCTEVRS